MLFGVGSHYKITTKDNNSLNKSKYNDNSSSQKSNKLNRKLVEAVIYSHTHIQPKRNYQVMRFFLLSELTCRFYLMIKNNYNKLSYQISKAYAEKGHDGTIIAEIILCL